MKTNACRNCSQQNKGVVMQVGIIDNVMVMVMWGQYSAKQGPCFAFFLNLFIIRDLYIVHFFENFPFPVAGSGDFPALTGMDRI